MKRRICLFLALVLTLGILSGCKQEPAPTEPPTTLPTEPTQTQTQPTTVVTAPTNPTDTTPTVPTDTPTQPTEPVPTVDPLVEALRENFPTIDGSTSLIPLEAGVRAAIFGKTIEEATMDVAHTTTWGSYYNLTGGHVDMIFSCPLSQEQISTSPIPLEMTPVAMEGFVFVVNAKNPVNKLSQQQLKDIYSGKITNWSQVGGLDEPIIAYQRNNDSGSQNFMIAFMGNTPLMDAPKEMRPASMSGLMDVIAVNDNARGAIGYSVYAYAANMYGNGNEIKFIEVDGVAPSKKTFSDGTYPLMGRNYAVFDARTPEDSPVRKLVEWMTGFDGQTAIANAGYVTMKNIGFDYEEMTFSKYSGVGAGSVYDKAYSYEHVLYSVIEDQWGTYSEPYMRTKVITLADGSKTYRVEGLADMALEDKIIAFIDEQMFEMAKVRPEMLAVVDRLNGELDYELYTPDAYLGSISPSEDGTAANCIVTCKNGYLTVVVALTYSYNVQDGRTHYYKTETATWDMLSGRRLEPEELFCWGVDVDKVLNAYVSAKSQEPINVWGNYPEMKRDFAALSTSGWHITPDAIYFDNDNPYFASGIQFPLDDLPEGTLVTEIPREFSDRINSSNMVVRKQFRTTDRDTYYDYCADGLISVGFLKESVHPNAAAVNQAVRTYIDTYYTESAIRGYFDSLKLDSTKVDLFMIDWYLENLGGKYLKFAGTTPSYYIHEENRFVMYEHPALMIFDLETGKQIPWTELLSGDWLANSKMVTGYPEIQVAPFLEGLTANYLYVERSSGWENYLWVNLYDGKNDYYLTVPDRYIRFE